MDLTEFLAIPLREPRNSKQKSGCLKFEGWATATATATMHKPIKKILRKKEEQA